MRAHEVSLTVQLEGVGYFHAVFDVDLVDEHEAESRAAMLDAHAIGAAQAILEHFDGFAARLEGRAAPARVLLEMTHALAIYLQRIHVRQSAEDLRTRILGAVAMLDGDFIPARIRGTEMRAAKAAPES